MTGTSISQAQEGEFKPRDTNDPPRVRFWFDPSCPFAWVTSRWVSQVAARRQFPVEWRLMSLAVLNEGKVVPEAYRRLMGEAWKPVRVIAAAACEHGTGVIKPLYDALGDAIHRQKLGVETSILQSLRQTQLPEDLADVAGTAKVDEAVRSSHREAQDIVGTEVGTPVVAIDKIAFFGPIITRAPQGEEAERLWDALVTLGQYPYFFELQRNRTEKPLIPLS